MRRVIHKLIYVAAVAFLSVLLTPASARAQLCPTVEVDCTERLAGEKAPMHCTADVSGDGWKNLVYQWSVSVEGSIKTLEGRPNEADIELGSNETKSVIVTVKVRGLPDGCGSEGHFDSRLADDEEEEEETATRPASPPLSPPPGIVTTCPSVVAEGEPAYFGVNLAEVEDGAKPTFKWTVSAGKIKGGHRGLFIAVDTADVGNQIIKATVEVGGVGRVVTASCKTRVTPQPRAYKLDEIVEKGPNEENERLRRFALRLNIGLDERAYIIAYGRRGQSTEEITARATRARVYLLDRFGVNPSRVVALYGGLRKESGLELWVVQAGGALPQTGKE